MAFHLLTVCSHRCFIAASCCSLFTRWNSFICWLASTFGMAVCRHSGCFYSSACRVWDPMDRRTRAHRSWVGCQRLLGDRDFRGFEPSQSHDYTLCISATTPGWIRAASPLYLIVCTVFRTFLFVHHHRVLHCQLWWWRFCSATSADTYWTCSLECPARRFFDHGVHLSLVEWLVCLATSISTFPPFSFSRCLCSSELFAWSRSIWIAWHFGV